MENNKDVFEMDFTYSVEGAYKMTQSISIDEFEHLKNLPRKDLFKVLEAKISGKQGVDADFLTIFLNKLEIKTEEFNLKCDLLDWSIYDKTIYYRIKGISLLGFSFWDPFDDKMNDYIEFDLDIKDYPSLRDLSMAEMREAILFMNMTEEEIVRFKAFLSNATPFLNPSVFDKNYKYLTLEAVQFDGGWITYNVGLIHSI